MTILNILFDFFLDKNMNFFFFKEPQLVILNIKIDYDLLIYVILDLSRHSR